MTRVNPQRAVGMNRRSLLAGGGALLTACAVNKIRPLRSIPIDAAAIVTATDPAIHLGMCAIDTAHHRMMSLHGEARFAMCSLFKVPLAAAVLTKVTSGQLRLTDPVRLSTSDLLDYAPVVRARLSEGQMSVGELCAAAVEMSDNSAANLLLPLIGGPAGLTRFMRNCGDPTSRLDRPEPALNSNLPGDDRDTTTPEAFARLLQTLLAGNALSPAACQHLIRWMIQSKTGKARIRAGLPASWPTGTKSGTGEHGAVNDCAIFWPRERKPVILVTLCSGGQATTAERENMTARIATHVADAAIQGFPA